MGSNISISLISGYKCEVEKVGLSSLRLWSPDAFCFTAGWGLLNLYLIKLVASSTDTIHRVRF